jgi:hypothetical protein
MLCSDSRKTDQQANFITLLQYESMKRCTHQLDNTPTLSRTTVFRPPEPYRLQSSVPIANSSQVHAHHQTRSYTPISRIPYISMQSMQPTYHPNTLKTSKPANYIHIFSYGTPLTKLLNDNISLLNSHFQFRTFNSNPNSSYPTN